MTTTVKNFLRKRGDSYPIDVYVVDDGGLPVDITDATFLLTVDPGEAPTTDAGNEFQSTGAITGVATNGLVRFAITAAQADLLGVFFYDVQMTASGGEITTILEGSITFDQDITKD